MSQFEVCIVGTGIREVVNASDHRSAGRQLVDKHAAKGPGRVTVEACGWTRSGRSGWQSFTLGRNGSLRYVCAYI